MNFKKNKGFTIIELLVVIAIISVLSSIVLVNVTQYINKSKDAAIKGNLATMLTNAAVYFEATPAGTGATYVATAQVTAAEAAINTAGGTAAHYGNTTTQAWCACSPEKVTSTTVFCVDSTGTKKETASTTCATQCVTPATGACL